MLDRGHDERGSQELPAPVVLGRDLPSYEPQTEPVPAVLLGGGQSSRDAEFETASADILGATECIDTQDVLAPVGESLTGDDTQCRTALADSLLLVYADALDDLERTRIATDNRLRSLRSEKGLDGTPEAARMEALVDSLCVLEHAAALDLQRALRKHPLGPWVKRTVGVGERQGARLIAALGDPAARANVAKLWQYAGHGDPERSRRRRGERAQFNPTAKMRTHLCAVSCVRQARSPYRPVYEAARVAWAGRETSELHKHNHAVRLVGKALLRDLWVEARAVRS